LHDAIIASSALHPLQLFHGYGAFGRDVGVAVVTALPRKQPRQHGLLLQVDHEQIQEN
jgi:hypothetical protein